MAGIDNNTIVYLNGDNFEDSSLNKYPILNEGITINNDGKFGSCFDFTKNSCSMIVNSDIRLPLDIFTIDWWEKDTGGSTTGSRSFLNNLPNSSDSSMRSFHIGKEDNSNIVKIWLSSNNSSWDIAQSVSIGNTHLNEWVHRAVINDGTNIKCYENGKLFINIPLNGKKIYPLDEKIRFGLMRNGTVSYGANVDEIRISNTVIWEDEFIPPTKQYSKSIDLEISENKLNIKVINKDMEKIEILINDIVCITYTNILDNFFYEIDKSKCNIGDNTIIARCFYNDGYVENYKLTHVVNVNMLPSSSSLKDVIDMQSLLNNSIENQRLKLKNILASKDVECSDTDKMSSLIDKVGDVESIPNSVPGDNLVLIKKYTTRNERLSSSSDTSPFIIASHISFFNGGIKFLVRTSAISLGAGKGKFYISIYSKDNVKKYDKIIELSKANTDFIVECDSIEYLDKIEISTSRPTSGYVEFSNWVLSTNLL